MPVVLLDRLPLPSLPAYTAVSVSLLACSLYYAAQNANQLDPEHQPPLAEGQLDLATLCWVFGRRCSAILTFMIHEPFCIWVSLISTDALEHRELLWQNKRQAPFFGRSFVLDWAVDTNARIARILRLM